MLQNKSHDALRKWYWIACFMVIFQEMLGCARVQQRHREFLSDPIMQLKPDPMGSDLESHNLPRREGSAGGHSGSGGGCGC